MRRGFDHSTKRLKVAAAGHYTERSQLYNTEDIWKEKTQCPRQEGKTSASRCVQQGSEMIETQEDIYVGSIETDRGVREQVRFYDTRGLRDGAELPRHCFSCTDGYVLVYSTDSRESFQRVELLKKEIDKSKDKKEVTIVVLGNKCDLQEQRRVDPDVAQHWAKSEKVKLWEVSVADRRSLLEPFVYLASRMTQPQSKSAFPLSRKNKGSGSLDG
ncbi:NF-kappa-B inhibitor-interacting Ras-like protein 2 isoform X1 [Neophocaena asiaeorientalis asiaeorientalis]|uniref:NF-kappa-B inhibitor-interacting Ras-like protein 2 isoform X1 n=1 Tax=Neophocaena asiaeorientalis asiaeorientalis TaxID=1706337 RepID=A0A341BG57_NEOAA|nr:NF-kappa-B inhibitor-interacting Ras-like protein 2 isoform X1 [Neophocaena asiaeorientalis asiaeorientalis]XP_032473537.1 NF-kappa-B inhibitor-interacting Ras-like protein 2 isoform X1 [Phocoena sinus]